MTECRGFSYPGNMSLVYSAAAWFTFT